MHSSYLEIYIDFVPGWNLHPLIQDQIEASKISLLLFKQSLQFVKKDNYVECRYFRSTSILPPNKSSRLLSLPQKPENLLLIKIAQARLSLALFGFFHVICQIVSPFLDCLLSQ